MRSRLLSIETTLGLGVGFREIDQRMALADLLARLIFAVKLVDVLDELAVQQMQRNVLRTDAACIRRNRCSARRHGTRG